MLNEFDSKNAILVKTFEFALTIVNYTNILYQNKQFVICNQLLKSGTSIGANIKESQHAESAQDFIHKLKIAAKEAAETEYWLLICKHSNFENCDRLLMMLEEIQKIISKIIFTTKTRIKK